MEAVVAKFATPGAFAHHHLQRGHRVSVFRAQKACAHVFDVGISKDAFERAIAVLQRDGTLRRQSTTKVAHACSARITFDESGKARCSRTELAGHMAPSPKLLLLACFETRLPPDSFGCEESFQHAFVLHSREFALDGAALLALHYQNADGSDTYELHAALGSADDYDASVAALEQLLP